MFEAKVYRVSVSTLGAILEEEQIAKETIQKWNTECSEEKGKLFLLSPERTSVTPDLSVVIVDSFVDITKIDKYIATGKPIVFFFSKYHDPNNSLQTEIDKIETFKKTVEMKYCCVDYNAARELGSALIPVLDSFGM